jgi:hypothetical protein
LAVGKRHDAQNAYLAIAALIIRDRAPVSHTPVCLRLAPERVRQNGGTPFASNVRALRSTCSSK